MTPRTSTSPPAGPKPVLIPARRRQQRDALQHPLFTNVAPGAGYSLSEMVPGGVGAVLRDLLRRIARHEHRRRPGENVTCTFVNRRLGRINVIKDAQPDDPQDFTFTTGGGLSPSTFLLDDDGGPINNPINNVYSSTASAAQRVLVPRRFRPAGAHLCDVLGRLFAVEHLRLRRARSCTASSSTRSAAASRSCRTRSPMIRRTSRSRRAAD